MSNENTITLKKGLQYTKIEPFAGGGQGTIWIVEGVKDKKLYALKTVSRYDREDVENSEEKIKVLIGYLEKEIDFLSSLKNPEKHFIVTCLDSGYSGEELYKLKLPSMLMPLYKMNTLADLIKQRAKETFSLTGAQWLLWFKQLIIALEYIQQMGAEGKQTIHRDIKPENCLFNAENQLILADFGILQENSRVTVSENHTIGYAAPEQVLAQYIDESSDKHYDITPAIDIYAAAITIYEIIVGKTRAQKALSLPRTTTQHQNKLFKEPRKRKGKVGDLGIIGGIETAEKEKLARELDKFFKRKAKTETVVVNESALFPDYKVINTAFIALFEQMLSPCPDDRPNATEVLKQLVDIEQALEPELIVFKLSPKTSSQTTEQLLTLNLALEGKGLPQHLEWLEVSINDNTILSPSFSRVDAENITLTLPLFEKIGDYNIKIETHLKKVLWTSKVSVSITPTAKELWLTGKREQALLISLKTSWLDQWEHEVKTAKEHDHLLEVLTRLQKQYPNDVVLTKRVETYSTRLGFSLAGKRLCLQQGQYYRVLEALEDNGISKLWKVRGKSDHPFYVLKTVTLYDRSSGLGTYSSHRMHATIAHAQTEIDFLCALKEPEKHSIVKCLDSGLIQRGNYQLPSMLLPFYPDNLGSYQLGRGDKKKTALLTGEQWLLWFKQLISALVYIQQDSPEKESVIHGDIQPKNCLLNDKNQLFLAHFIPLETSSKTEGCLFDDMAYSATSCTPEQVLAQSRTDTGHFLYYLTPAIDIYATALTMYSLIVGETEAQQQLNSNITRTQHRIDLIQGKIVEGEVGLLGKIGGLEKQETIHLRQVLSTLFKAAKPLGASTTLPPEERVSLPEYSAINLDVVTLLQKMLSPWPGDRPNATRVLKQLNAIERALQPKITQFELAPKTSSININDTLVLKINIKGNGLPQDFKWLQVKINDKPLVNPSFSRVNVGYISLIFPLFQTIGDKRVEVSSLINRVPYTDEVIVVVTPSARQLWQKGKREEALILELKDRWLAEWAQQATTNSEKYEVLAALTRLQQHYPANELLKIYLQRIDNSVKEPQTPPPKGNGAEKKRGQERKIIALQDQIITLNEKITEEEEKIKNSRTVILFLQKEISLFDRKYKRMIFITVLSCFLLISVGGVAYYEILGGGGGSIVVSMTIDEALKKEADELQKRFSSKDEKIKKEAFDTIKKLAKKHDNFRHWLGRIYWYGLEGTKVDYEKAWVAFNRTLKRDEIGKASLNGLEKDVLKLVESDDKEERLRVYPALEVMAKNGNREAQWLRATLSFDGKDHYLKNKKEGIVWAEKAAKQGHPQAIEHVNSQK